MEKQNSMRLQSAIDYLVTYGWAILIITAALSLIYFYASGQLLALPSGCHLPTEVGCSDLAAGSNTATLTVQLILINSQQYPITNPTVLVNISNHGNLLSTCSPSYVLPGGKILCSATGPGLPINQQISGFLVVNESVCPIIGATGCSKPFKESFNGTYATTISSSSPAISCSISVVPVSSTISHGTQDQVDANILFSGFSVSGATVSFTTNSVYATFSQGYSLSNPNGTATDFVTSTQPASVTVTGNFMTGCLTSSIITFT